MKSLTIACAAVAALLLGACAGPGLLEDARNQNVTGSEFTRALHQGYISRSQSEMDEADWPDNRRFAEKALAAGRDGDVQPDSFANRKIDSEYQSELSAARTRLMAARDGGGKDAAPSELAFAQTSFDCWMQEQEEDWQPDDIAACKNGFNSAMGRVEASLAAMQPEPEPEPAPMPAPAPVVEPEPEPLPGPYIVFFDFDSAELTDQSRAILDVAAEQIPAADVTRIMIVGHTDTAGANSYNDALSTRRAEAVAAYLAAAGISRGMMSISARGESDLAVSTADNIREPRNRRVEINVE